MLNKVLTYLLT